MLSYAARSGMVGAVFLWIGASCASGAATQSSDPGQAGPVRSANLSVAVAEDCSDVNVLREVAVAESIVAKFAQDQGWDSSLAMHTFDSVEVFGSQDALWHRILDLNNLPADTPLPAAGLVAGLENRVLVAVCPKEYQRLNPDYAAYADSWRRLLAHEIAHRFHVNILNGDDDAMGPSWFYEGFAVIASGQKLDHGLEYTSPAEALAAVHEKGPLAYRRYAAALRFFSQHIPLATMVRKASAEELESWLANRVDHDDSGAMP